MAQYWLKKIESTIYTMIVRYKYKPILLVLIASSVLVIGCKRPDAPKPIEYKGALREAEDIEVLSTEKDQMKSKMKAKKVLEFQNGDMELPEGMFLETYDETGKLTSTLKADSAYYFKEEDKWRARGHVEVFNLEKQEKLTTDELFWKPTTKKIFTEKFFTLVEPTGIISGFKLQANQDLSEYSFEDTAGDLEID